MTLLISKAAIRREFHKCGVKVSASSMDILNNRMQRSIAEAAARARKQKRPIVNDEHFFELFPEE
jgi:hypothetical protein